MPFTRRKSGSRQQLLGEWAGSCLPGCGDALGSTIQLPSIGEPPVGKQQPVRPGTGPRGPDLTSVLGSSCVSWHPCSLPPKRSHSGLFPEDSILLKRCPWGFEMNFTVSLNTVVLWPIGPQGDLPKALRIRHYSPSQVAEGILLSWLRVTELPVEHPGARNTQSCIRGRAPTPNDYKSSLFFFPWHLPAVAMAPRGWSQSPC